MADLVIIKVGETFADTAEQFGDFDDWVLAGLEESTLPIRVVELLKGETLPESSLCAGIVVTGSHAMVTEALPWSTKLEKWLVSAVSDDIPVLGICYGHQVLANALGGTVDYHPKGPEIGCFEVCLRQAAASDPLFSRLPVRFKAHLTHHQSVMELPKGAVTLANSHHEAYQAYRVGNHVWGVQFHPEYSKAVMAAYLDKQRHVLEVNGQDYAELEAHIQDTDIAKQILPLFADYVAGHVELR
ncbi:MAG TPA: glutamine amidotransferase [Marinagarivorans sp.]